MDRINSFVGTLNGFLFHDYVVYTLLLTGVLFTVWSGFGQFRALTHGVSVIRGKYDNKDDPGAISHFQALSAALSATVGLGNIGGVALAVALGGPGAVFWMWVIGILGMALKMTEVTQSMLYRNTDDPENPHGGPMYVVSEGLKKWGLGTLGKVLGGVFCVTLLVSAITGGNMFQAWNVAEVTHQYIPTIPKIAVGIFLAVLVGMVISGGIKRIGAVAGKLVPFMCALYLSVGVYALIMNAGVIPEMLVLIVRAGIGLETSSPAGAFVGGTLGYAAMWGIKRALFSSEAGQGSAPIAHAAARCNEPVREGIVSGLEPFIDTLVVCTVTALVILSSGAWNRGEEASFDADAPISVVAVADGGWTLETPALNDKNAEAKRINQVKPGDSGWDDGEKVFMLVTADDNEDTGANIHRLTGEVSETDGVYTGEWDTYEGEAEPVLVNRGVYVNYAGAGLTAHAFDRVKPGLGMWLIMASAWLFAISTMISWSYYGEQGVYYLFSFVGKESMGSVVLVYKLIYCLLIAASTLPFIKTDADLDMWTTLGLGLMLVANIPIMLIFGSQAMKAYHEYNRKLKAGEFEPK